jgi:hypothetical protein
LVFLAIEQRFIHLAGCTAGNVPGEKLSCAWDILGAVMSIPARPPESSAAPGDLHWFSGATDRGELSLGLPPASPHADVVAQVLALGEAEPLIAAVEQWLEVAWDPAPVAQPPARAHALEVRSARLAPVGTRLLFGADLGQAAEPPEALRAPHVAWSLCDSAICLGQVPAAASALLEPGALVWIPASFQQPWRAQIRGPFGARAAVVDLSAGHLCAEPVAAQQAASPAADAGELDVVLQHPQAVPLDVALGWPRAEPWRLPLQTHALSRARQARGQRLAHGGLLPMGRGHAMRISVLAEPVVSAAPVADPACEQ